MLSTADMHHDDVFNIRMEDFLVDSARQPIPDDDPCFIDGVITVDDSPFTTRVKLGSGTSVSTHYCCVALPGTD